MSYAYTHCIQDALPGHTRRALLDEPKYEASGTHEVSKNFSEHVVQAFPPSQIWVEMPSPALRFADQKMIAYVLDACY